MTRNTGILRHHHITLNVGTAQEDYDFHTKVLGLKSVKKTCVYTGRMPLHHLYYGNDVGQESTLVTCFTMRRFGRRGRPGAGQITALALSVPVSSLSFWEAHLREHGFDVSWGERFGEKLISFHHPCGIEYQLVGIADDGRTPYSNGVVPAGFGIRGTHGIVVSVREIENSDRFMQEVWSGGRRRSDGAFVRYEVGAGGSGTIVDFNVNPTSPVGTCGYAEGVVDHCAFQVENLDVQSDIKAHLEAVGYADVSDRKDRGYFDSVYLRTPGGPLFEAAVSKEKGFLVDESYADLGKSLKTSPQFEERKESLVAMLDPLVY